MSTLDEIIARMIQASGTKNTANMLESMGFSNSVASAWKRRKKIPDGAIVKVSERTGVRFEWLKTGKGDMHQTAASNPALESVVREHADQWNKLGTPPSDFEVRIVGMLRRLTPETRQRFLDLITSAYFDEMESG